MKDKAPDISPEALADWLGKVEDKLWIAAQDAAAARFLLGNLVLELGRAEVIDAPRFIRNLLAVASTHPDHPQAVREVLEELLRCLQAPGGSGACGEPGAPPVFH